MSGWTAVDDTENDVEGEKVEGPVDIMAYKSPYRIRPFAFVALP